MKNLPSKRKWKYLPINCLVYLGLKSVELSNKETLLIPVKINNKATLAFPPSSAHKCCENRIPNVSKPPKQSGTLPYYDLQWARYNDLIMCHFHHFLFPSALTTSPFCLCSEESQWPRFNQRWFLFFLPSAPSILELFAAQPPAPNPRCASTSALWPTSPWKQLHNALTVHPRPREGVREKCRDDGMAVPPLSVPPALFTSCPAHWWGDYLTQIWRCNCLRGVCLPSSFEFHLIVVTVILVITRLRLRWAVTPVAPPILCHMLP